MQLVDVSLAFALTMAALATVVTVVMEICLRVIRMRKKNFVSVMQLLNKELDKGYLDMGTAERWQFFVRVLKNPAVASQPWPAPNLHNEKIEDHLAAIRKSRLAGVFEKVSLEYLLRCLAECDVVKKASHETGEAIRAEFNRIARKYEEFSSSVSESFKLNSQSWSIIIGIVLAFVANIDGLRIFQAYRSDPELVMAVIEKQDTFIEENQNVQNALQKYTDLREKLDETDKKLAAAIQNNTTDVAALKKEKEELDAAIAQQSGIAEIQKTIQNSRQQIANLVSLGVPIGWDYYPNCPYGKTELDWAMSDAQCQGVPEKAHDFNDSKYHYRAVQTLMKDFPGMVAWLFRVMFSGILIGLGAPFWFDVAKRLSQIRKGLQNASASTEYRFSARNANGDPEKRREIVDTVLADAAEAFNNRTTTRKSKKNSPQLGPKAIHL